jgi:hypothetical protein
MIGNPRFRNLGIAHQPCKRAILLGGITTMAIRIVATIYRRFQGKMIGKVVHGGGNSGTGLSRFGTVSAHKDGVACPIGAILKRDGIDNGAIQSNQSVIARLTTFTTIVGGFKEVNSTIY